MRQAKVHDILDQILQLPAEDRLRLDELLAQQEEREWREEAARARRTASEQGLDQEAVDRAVRAVRQLVRKSALPRFDDKRPWAVVLATTATDVAETIKSPGGVACGRAREVADIASLAVLRPGTSSSTSPR